MGRRVWDWKAVGDRVGSVQESLQLHPRGSVKAKEKKESLLCVRACPSNCVSPFHCSPHALLNESVLCFRCESNDEEVPAP
jgi:hypothetical protein